MKNILKLINDQVALIKNWVESGFNQLQNDFDIKNQQLKDAFEARVIDISKDIDIKIQKLSNIEDRLIKLKSDINQETVGTIERFYLKFESQNKESIEEFKQSVLKTLDEIPTPKDGKDGIDGQNGIDGKSITVDDVRPIITDLVEQSVARIPLPKDGRDGANGKDGESVSLDHIERSIDKSVQKHVANIPTPKDGEPGRDALQIDVLPAINPEKSYPRGTFASHNGGLWHSHMKTEGMRGWDCIVAGESQVEVIQTNERSFQIIKTDSVGNESKTTYSMPVMIYRGVYKEGDQYSAGDTCTWGGSLWHCDKDTHEKPGQGKDWTLCAKKGRDGK